MKNSNILGFHGKIRFLRGVHEKPICRGDCLKRGAWIVCRFKVGGGLVRKAGGVLEWACYPNAHYVVETIIVRGVFRTL